MYRKKHPYQRPEEAPEGGASTSTGSAPEPTTPDPAPAVEAPAASEPADPFKGLTEALEAVGKPEVAELPGTPEPEAAPEAKTGTPPPVIPPEPASDLIPPEGITDRARTRWGELAERAKQVPVLEQQATEARREVEAVRTMVQASGLDPDEFRGALEMGRLFKSQNPQDLQAALQRIEGLRADLSARLGIDAPGIDLLAAHPDLKTKVDGLTLSREDALEIVRLRGVQSAHENVQRTGEQDRQFRAQVSTAAAEMDQILAQRAATPGHEAKVNHIRSYFADPARLQSFVTTYQPQQWKAAVMMMYDSYQPPPPPTPSTTRQPLRPTPTGGGARVNTTPRTAEDAVMGAFERLGI